MYVTPFWPRFVLVIHPSKLQNFNVERPVGYLGSSWCCDSSPNILFYGYVLVLRVDGGYQSWRRALFTGAGLIYVSSSCFALHAWSAMVPGYLVFSFLVLYSRPGAVCAILQTPLCRCRWCFMRPSGLKASCFKLHASCLGRHYGSLFVSDYKPLHSPGILVNPVE